MLISCPFCPVTGEESCLRSARGWQQVISHSTAKMRLGAGIAQRAHSTMPRSAYSGRPMGIESNREELVFEIGETIVSERATSTSCFVRLTDDRRGAKCSTMEPVLGKARSSLRSHQWGIFFRTVAVMDTLALRGIVDGHT